MPHFAKPIRELNCLEKQTNYDRGCLGRIVAFGGAIDSRESGR